MTPHIFSVHIRRHYQCHKPLQMHVIMRAQGRVPLLLHVVAVWLPRAVLMVSPVGTPLRVSDDSNTRGMENGGALKRYSSPMCHTAVHTEYRLQQKRHLEWWPTKPCLPHGPTAPPSAKPGVSQGAFWHSARTAPIITLFIPGTPLQTTPLQKHA